MLFIIVVGGVICVMFCRIRFICLFSCISVLLMVICFCVCVGSSSGRLIFVVMLVIDCYFCIGVCIKGVG